MNLIVKDKPSSASYLDYTPHEPSDYCCAYFQQERYAYRIEEYFTVCLFTRYTVEERMSQCRVVFCDADNGC